MSKKKPKIKHPDFCRCRKCTEGIRPHERIAKAYSQSISDAALARDNEVDMFDFTCRTGAYKIRGKQELFVKGFRYGVPNYSRTADHFRWKTKTNAVSYAEYCINQWNTDFKKLSNSATVGGLLILEIYNTQTGETDPLFENLSLAIQSKLLKVADPRDIIQMRDRFPKTLKKYLRENA
jgi:hypothetical protein